VRRTLDAAACERLAVLVAEIERFHITDRRMKGEHGRIVRALRDVRGLTLPDARRYLRAVERYFVPFEREARQRLADVERRLANASQLQFNLTAERGVGRKRVDATQGVLRQLQECAPR